MKIGILFDLDGTLLDTLEDLRDAVNYALAQYGCPARSLSEVREFVGNGAGQLIRLALPGKENDPPAKTVLNTFRTYYNAHCAVRTKPYDGILEALAALRREYPLAIVSNKPDSAVKPLCRSYFGDLYARGENSDCPRKPAPDMVHKAMEAIGVDTCIYVGDSEVDVLTAQNAGVPCLSVLWGFRDRQVMANAGGMYFCESPRELPEKIHQLVEKLWKE